MKNNNIKNNLLSLKSLKQELEALKADKSVQLNTNMSSSKFNRAYMQSSAFTLWLISGIISYAHKIPFISRIIALLGLWYGKTTWWRILLWSRKIFVVINAIIGVFVVFKGVGFTTDNLLAGFAGIGQTYLDIITSLSKRLFNWFYNLIDNKVMPNNPPSNWWSDHFKPGWYKKPINNDGLGKIMDLAQSQDFYKSPLNVSLNYQSSWYKDWSNWLWIGGAVVSVGLLYFGYKFLTDPTFISNLDHNSQHTDLPDDIPDITIFDARSSTESIAENVSSVTNKLVDKLNPLNYLPDFSERTRLRKFNDFMIKQNIPNSADRSLYPFTEVNPHDTWLRKLSLYFYGEPTHENFARLAVRRKADALYEAIAISNGRFTEVGGLTPAPYIASSLGLGQITPFPSNSLWDIKGK